jgi:predicted GNAT family acetyltransferase
MADVEIRKNEAESRYEAYVDGRLAGFAAYRLDDQQIVFTHTEVDDSLEGQGVGSSLARGALDDVRADGTRRVVAQCEFIRDWIEKHPDYEDLVSGAGASQ